MKFQLNTTLFSAKQALQLQDVCRQTLYGRLTILAKLGMAAGEIGWKL